MKVIDTCGLLCPAPLIATKRAIMNSPGEVSFRILSDNSTSCDNLMNYLRELGFSPVCENTSGVYNIVFSVDGSAESPIEKVVNVETNMVCNVPAGDSRDYIVVLKSHVMGDGDADLGVLLMRSCVNSLIELKTLPSAIIMYNSGVLLASGESDTAKSLRTLEQKGVAVILCGACVDFFEIKNSIYAGRVGNMMMINTLLSRTGHVIYP